MSLNVYLHGPATVVRRKCVECGTLHDDEERATYYDANITHNLGGMANEAGIYEALWRPGEIGVQTAGQLAPILRVGIAKMEERPEHFRQFDAPNGWGTFEQFLPWVKRYLRACEENPDATVRVSR